MITIDNERIHLYLDNITIIRRYVVSRAKPAYANIHKSGNVAITTARERKKQQIICALLTVGYRSSSKKSADNLMSLSFLSYIYSYVASLKNS